MHPKEKKLRGHIRREIKKTLTESKSEKIFIDKHNNWLQLWITFSPGSGKTKILKNLKNYYTNKEGDGHYGDVVNDLLKWEKGEKPIKKKGHMRIYEVPVYGLSKYKQINNDLHISDDVLSIWGGKMKPETYYYLLISDFGPGNSNNQIVSFFETKKEALSWLKHSTSEGKINENDKEKVYRDQVIWNLQDALYSLGTISHDEKTKHLENEAIKLQSILGKFLKKLQKIK